MQKDFKIHRPKTNIDPCTLNLFTAVNFRSLSPIQYQVQSLIKFAINSGKLKPGDLLPSRNNLLQILDVQIDAIKTACHELNILGILTFRRGFGVYVSPKAPSIYATHCQTILAQNMYEVMQEVKAARMDVKIVKIIVDECLKMELQLYSEAPADLMKMAKRK